MSAGCQSCMASAFPVLVIVAIYVLLLVYDSPSMNGFPSALASVLRVRNVVSDKLEVVSDISTSRCQSIP